MTDIRHPRPLLITFHCGLFFFIYAVFVMHIGRQDVEAHYSSLETHATYIRDMLVLLSVNFFGYLALWNMRRMAIPILLVGGVALVGYGVVKGVFAIHFCFPIVAALTTAPMWPVLKTP